MKKQINYKKKQEIQNKTLEELLDKYNKMGLENSKIKIILKEKENDVIVLNKEINR